MAQFSRPNGDIAIGSWTTSPLWSKIDEGADGGDTITSDTVGNGVTTSIYDCKLSSITDPVSSSGHILRARWAVTTNKGLDASFILYLGNPGSGGTAIYTLTTLLTDTPEVTSEITLDGASADAITDYGNLYGRFYGVGNGGGPARGLVIEFAELQTPNAPGSVIMANMADYHFRRRRNN